MTNKLAGKVALITGGNSGIGLATAQRFVAEGAYVFITGRRQDALDAAVERIGKNVTAVVGDVSNLADLDRLYATVGQEQGRLDVIFANAGSLLVIKYFPLCCPPAINLNNLPCHIARCSKEKCCICHFITVTLTFERNSGYCRRN